MKSEKLWDNVGDASIKLLWEAVESKSGYENTDKYKELRAQLSESLEKVTDTNLKNNLEEALNATIGDSMFQGFELGLREAFQLLISLGGKNEEISGIIY